ncbi:hypothetical protein [uncultured Bradyrhizobium sp.]|uniref:hypothetical protein n=1 Tax=uncultured Bradyrhizobium sp. TaxID=199684 RepID=UPI0035C9F098
MATVRSNRSDAALVSLETAEASARSGFACMFSGSDEYESALITERRAQGRYSRPRTNWPMIAFIGCCVMVVGFVAAFSP